MAQEFSFDIVSKTDMQEVANAIQQAQKELAQRFDFKGSKSSIELTNDEIILSSDDEGKLRSVKDIVDSKLVKRQVSLKAIEYGVQIARAIRKADLKSINVITNALNVAALLLDVPSVSLIVPGGILRRESNSLSGPMAEAALANLQADRLYLGADGLDPEIGVMTPHLQEAELNAKMIRISRQVVVWRPLASLSRTSAVAWISSPQRSLMRVDLPTPEEPMNTIVSPGRIHCGLQGGHPPKAGRRICPLQSRLRAWKKGPARRGQCRLQGGGTPQTRCRAFSLRSRYFSAVRRASR